MTQSSAECFREQVNSNRGRFMYRKSSYGAITLALIMTSSACGQVVGGVMTVTGAEMH